MKVILLLVSVAVAASMKKTEINLDEELSMDFSVSSSEFLEQKKNPGERQTFSLTLERIPEDNESVSFNEPKTTASAAAAKKADSIVKKAKVPADDISKNSSNAKDEKSDETGDSFIDYEHLSGGVLPTGIIFVVVLVLFFVMYVVSSDYLTPALAHLSAACRMSPDMAGLTFLAFGNGAPDLFTALSGAQEAPGMIISSSIGSGLFIFTVVFGLVICFAREGSLPSANAPLIPTTGAPLVKIGRGTFWRNILMYAFCVAVLGVFVISKKIRFWEACALVLCFGAYLSLSIAIHYLRKAKKQTSLGKVEENEQDESMLLLEIERVRFKLRQRSLADQVTFLISREIGWEEMDVISRCLWFFTLPLRFLLCFTIMPLPDPTLLNDPEKFVAHSQVLQFLIPLNPCASVPLMTWMTGTWPILIQKFGLSLSIALVSGLSLFLAGLLLVAINAISLSSNCHESKFTEKLPLYAVAVYSFACCIGWIYVASNELVAAILALGPRLGVSPTIMGSLMLAWGNSIGDLIADLALARNGIPQTAITAIFSGPIQNVLLTLGISFMYAASSGTVLLPELKKDVIFGLLVLAGVVGLSVLMIPGYFAYRIPRWFGMLLIAIYIVYVPFSIILSL